MLRLRVVALGSLTASASSALLCVHILPTPKVDFAFLVLSFFSCLDILLFLFLSF